MGTLEYLSSLLAMSLVACKSYIPAAGADNSSQLSSSCQNRAASMACLLQLLSPNKSWSNPLAFGPCGRWQFNSSDSIVSTKAQECVVIFLYSYSSTLFVPVTPWLLQKVLKQELSQGIRSRALGPEILSNIFQNLVSESSFALSLI